MMTSVVDERTSIGRIQLPPELIGHVLCFLDGRSLTSFELTCVLTRRYLRDNSGFFKHLLLREVFNFPQMASLQNKDGKRALIAWDGGDFQPVSASRTSLISPSPRYLHRVALGNDGWYYLFGGHLRLGMSGEVWRFRAEERGECKSCAVGRPIVLKWEQVDGDALEGIFGLDNDDDAGILGSDSDSHPGSEESDSTNGMVDGEGSDMNSGDDEAENRNGGGPAALFIEPQVEQNQAAGGLFAAVGADNAHGHAVHLLQAAMWAGQPAAVGGGYGNPPGLDADGNPTRPSPRCAASWTCIPGSNDIYLFGGLGSDNNFLGDLWCFHAGSRVQAHWERLRAVREADDGGPELESGEVSIPAGRWGHTMVEHKGLLYMFGGSSPGQAYTGLWRLDASARPCSWSLLKSEGDKPPPRGGHSATVVRDTLYIFGGNITQSVFNDLWAIDLPVGNSWRQITTTPDFPLPRIGHSAVAMGSRILIFGGRNFNTRKYTAGLSCFDTDLQAFVRFPHAEAFAKRSTQCGGMWHALRMTGHAAVPCSRGILFVGGLVHNGHSTMGAWVLDTVRGRKNTVRRRRRRRNRALATTGGCGQS